MNTTTLYTYAENLRSLYFELKIISAADGQVGSFSDDEATKANESLTTKTLFYLDPPTSIVAIRNFSGLPTVTALPIAFPKEKLAILLVQLEEITTRTGINEDRCEDKKDGTDNRNLVLSTEKTVTCNGPLKITIDDTWSLSAEQLFVDKQVSTIIYFGTEH